MSKYLATIYTAFIHAFIPTYYCKIKLHSTLTYDLIVDLSFLLPLLFIKMLNATNKNTDPESS